MKMPSAEVLGASSVQARKFSYLGSARSPPGKGTSTTVAANTSYSRRSASESCSTRLGQGNHFIAGRFDALHLSQERRFVEAPQVQGRLEADADLHEAGLFQKAHGAGRVLPAVGAQLVEALLLGKGRQGCQQSPAYAATLPGRIDDHEEAVETRLGRPERKQALAIAGYLSLLGLCHEAQARIAGRIGPLPMLLLLQGGRLVGEDLVQDRDQGWDVVAGEIAQAGFGLRLCCFHGVPLFLKPW